MELTELSLLDYLTKLAAECRAPIADYYMGRICEGGGRAYALSDDESLCSYALLLKDDSGMVLSYVYTLEALRRRGCAERLVRKILSATGADMTVHIAGSHPAYDAICAMLKKIGFEAGDVSDITTVPVNAQAWENWEKTSRFDLGRMKAFLLRDGSRCIPFAEMEPEIRDQLLHSTQNAFRNSLDPAPFLRQSATKIDMLLSTVLVKGGEVRGYTLISRLTENTVCFEQIASAKEEIGSGSILAPLCCTLEGIRSQPQITKLMLTIYRDNTRSLGLVGELLQGVEVHSQENSAYRYRNRKKTVRAHGSGKRRR